jgi:hypothetical protein
VIVAVEEEPPAEPVLVIRTIGDLHVGRAFL